MSSKSRLLTLVGTRPELIRLSRLIPELDRDFNHLFVHSGQNATAELKEVFFKDLGIRDPDITYVTDNSSLAASIGSSFQELERILEDFRPDAFLCLGDTTSALGLILAKKMGAVTYHLEAGNRSFDDRVPEEINRRIIDHTADFNLAYSRRSYENLIREGINSRFAAISGSPMLEILSANRQAIEDSQVLRQLGLAEGEFLLLSLHRQETVNSKEKLGRAMESVARAIEVTGLPCVLSIHPRTRTKVNEFSITIPDGVVVSRPFGFLDYQKLQKSALVTLSDSGTLSEEAMILGIRALLLRESTERPEAVEAGGLIMVGISPHSVEWGLAHILSEQPAKPALPEGYGEVAFSKRVSRFLLSTLPFASQWKNLGP